MVLFILTGFVDFNSLAVEFNEMHDFDGIVSVFFASEFHKPKTIMLIGDLVPWQMDIDDWSTLHEQLPQDLLVHSSVYIADVECSLLVAFKYRSQKSTYHY